MKHLWALIWLAVVISGTAPRRGRCAAPADRPNVLIIIADDCTYSDLPVYGGRNVATPRIESLALEGLVFDRAFLSIAMCNPCRTELYTGLYPAHSGACWNHSAARPGTLSIVHHLQRRGYRVGLAGKRHVSPAQTFPFEWIDGLERSCVSVTARYDEAGIREFITRDSEQPFCLVVALVVPHCPWTVGDPTHFPPAQIALPPNVADTSETRKDFAKYLAEIEVLDQHVGRTLDVLHHSGKDEQTLVLFTSEQGSQMPGNKWTNWNTGVHTALIARWPGRIRPGRTQAMVQYSDIVPTLVAAAGGPSESLNVDGTSFLPVLLGQSRQHRRFAYFMHNNIPEGAPYPIRSVTDGRYHYIRNLMPDRIYMEKHLMGQMQWHKYWPSWIFEATFDPEVNRLVNRYLHRPAEQLYDLQSDPFELNNLAGKPARQAVQRQLSAELDRWIESQHDPGAALDCREQWQASKKGRHFPWGDE